MRDKTLYKIKSYVISGASTLIDMLLTSQFAIILLKIVVPIWYISWFRAFLPLMIAAVVFIIAVIAAGIIEVIRRRKRVQRIMRQVKQNKYNGGNSNG